MRQIIIDKSIERSRVVYKFNFSLVGDYLLMCILGLSVPVISIKLILFPSSSAQTPSFDIAIFVLYDIWMILNLFFMNKLVAIEGTSFDENKRSITEVLDNEFPKISFTSGNPNIIRGQKPETPWVQRGKVVTVILNETSLYINILSTYRGGSFSFFNGFFNYLKSRSVAKSFKYLETSFS